MKLYRALNYQTNNYIGYFARLDGKFNEASNVLNANAFSPSFGYLKNSINNSSNYHSFLLEKKLYKFFYASLLDALLWAKDYNQEIFIIEINLPLESLEKCFGVGYYTNYCRLELCLPYKYLYELTKKNNNPNFLKCLNILENGQKINIENFNLDSSSLIPNLATFNANQLYPYLCFESNEPIKVLNFPKERKIFKVIKQKELERPLEYLKGIAKKGYPNIPYIKEEGLNYIKEENAEIKRVLQKDGYIFK